MEMVMDPHRMAELALRIRSWADRLASSAAQIRRLQGIAGTDEADAMGRAVVHVAALLLAEADDLEHTAQQLEQAMSSPFGLSDIAAVLCGPTAFVATGGSAAATDNRWTSAIDRLLQSGFTVRVESVDAAEPTDRDRARRIGMPIHGSFAAGPLTPPGWWSSHRPGSPPVGEGESGRRHS